MLTAGSYSGLFQIMICSYIGTLYKTFTNVSRIVLVIIFGSKLSEFTVFDYFFDSERELKSISTYSF